MHNTSLLSLLLAAACAAIPALAQDPELPPAKSAVSPTEQLKLDLEHFRSSYSSGNLGLKPPGTSSRRTVELPFGMNYSRDSKSLFMPLDDKNEWDIGLNLNINRARDVELAPSGLGLQPKRTPGVVINRKF